MKTRDEILEELIRVEGGYSNYIEDSGGETMYGITKKIALKNGYSGEMGELPKSFALNIYKTIYWDSIRLTEIEKITNIKLSEKLANIAINMGTYRAISFLQRSLNALNNRGKLYKDISIDGKIGDITIETLKHMIKARKLKAASMLYKMINCLQGAFYIKLSERRSKDKKFIYGWFNQRIT